ncbi:putative methyltransferase type 11 protein [Rosellinia necatrix]|uniref:Putative methyltransferase type 11 protein n=1 Tax=Rosellinia necatrix TaxID=77044 RepID=A0A1W2TJM2_ROSNE|nr:putative methyltransferase type 11 protein [Rosellinia necatrix]
MASDTPTPTTASPFSRGVLYEKLVGETSTRLCAIALSYLPLASYTSDSRILDSASGPGIATKLLLSPAPPDYLPPAVAGLLPLASAPRVEAVDASAAMVARYRANAAALGWATATAAQRDAQDLSAFATASFDAVVMGLGIFALRDAAAGAAEMRRVLRPGARALVTTWKTRRPQDLMAHAAAVIRPPGAPGAGGGSSSSAMDLDPKWLTSGHLVDVMVAGGFRPEDIEVHEAAPDWRLGSREALLEALGSPMWTAVFCDGWSEEERARWPVEIEKLLTEEEKATGTLSMVAHICVARKEG